MYRQSKKNLNKMRGFSLVELMVVVAIIGTLASIALPKFQVFQAKAKQAEAKTNLQGIYTYQLSYNGEYGSYFNNDYLTTNWTKFFGASKKYTYSMVNTNQTFTASASIAASALAKCQAAADIWTINEDNTLSNTTKGLESCGM